MSYDRRKFMQALAERGFIVLREGSNHTIIGKPGGRPEPVPRHREVNRITARKIAKNLGVEWGAFEKEIR